MLLQALVDEGLLFLLSVDSDSDSVMCARRKHAYVWE
jgi:hypothetical protein